jgi:protein-S-isoprenylcysteine O-methyltransferase Ste14
MIIAFILLLEGTVHLGSLDGRFLSISQSGTGIGIGLTACGIALAIWARHYLGANWSATITIRNSHFLVRTGPYSRMRHPMYSGLLLAIAGTALARGEWRGLLALAIAVIGWAIKARKEESWLRNEFGVQFEEYHQRSGFLLPRLTN